MAKILNFDHMGDSIRAATGVKTCSATTTKGFVSVAIQSSTAAHQVDALPVLQAYLHTKYPLTLALAGKGLTTMPQKVPCWAYEMSEIRKTMGEDPNSQYDLFYGVSELYTAIVGDSKVDGLRQDHGTSRGTA